MFISIRQRFIDKFSLNPLLKDKILRMVPDYFTLIQKTYLIYKLLCMEFVYDEEFYYLNHSVPSKNHLDLLRLSNLNGGEEIICIEFGLIFAKFLEEYNLSFDFLDYDNRKVNRLSNNHMKVRFMVGNYLIEADGADGLFHSDMTMQKTLNIVNGFNLVNGSNEMLESFEKEIEEVDKYFENLYKELVEEDKAISIYRRVCFQENEEYSKMSFNERITLFIDILKSSKLKNFDLLILATTLRKYLFSECLDNVIVEFIINKTIGENEWYKWNLNILIAYNEENHLYDEFTSNNYVVIDQNKTIEELTYLELRHRFSIYRYNYTSRERAVLNLKEGVFYDERIAKRRIKNRVN